MAFTKSFLFFSLLLAFVAYSFCASTVVAPKTDEPIYFHLKLVPITSGSSRASVSLEYVNANKATTSVTFAFASEAARGLFVTKAIELRKPAAEQTFDLAAPIDTEFDFTAKLTLGNGLIFKLACAHGPASDGAHAAGTIKVTITEVQKPSPLPAVYTVYEKPVFDATDNKLTLKDKTYYAGDATLREAIDLAKGSETLLFRYELSALALNTFISSKGFPAYLDIIDGEDHYLIKMTDAQVGDLSFYKQRASVLSKIGHAALWTFVPSIGCILVVTIIYSQISPEDFEEGARSSVVLGPAVRWVFGISAVSDSMDDEGEEKSEPEEGEGELLDASASGSTSVGQGSRRTRPDKSPVLPVEKPVEEAPTPSAAMPVLGAAALSFVALFLL